MNSSTRNFPSPSLPCRMIAGVLLASLASNGQSPDTPIFQQGGRDQKSEIAALSEKLLKIKESLAVIGKTEIDSQRNEPRPKSVTLPPPQENKHSTEELATLCRKANLRVGYLYLCTKCDNWHLNTAGSYAIAEDVIVTCDHVLDNKTEMKEGYFVAISDDGKLAVTTAVLARNQIMDVAILQVAGDKLTPVPLNSNIRQGSDACCFSTPLGQQGYFSTGIVNRFYWNADYRGQDQGSIDALFHLRMDLSTDWAPGSSGSPLFDRSGNVIGHVSTIAGLGSGKGKGGPLLTIHTGIPARCVQELVARMDDEKEIRRIASLQGTTETKTKSAE